MYIGAGGKKGLWRGASIKKYDSPVVANDRKKKITMKTKKNSRAKNNRQKGKTRKGNSVKKRIDGDAKGKRGIAAKKRD